MLSIFESGNCTKQREGIEIEIEIDRGAGEEGRRVRGRRQRRKWDTALWCHRRARASDTMRMTRIRERAKRRGSEVTLSGALTHHDEP